MNNLQASIQKSSDIYDKKKQLEEQNKKREDEKLQDKI